MNQHSLRLSHKQPNYAILILINNVNSLKCLYRINKLTGILGLIQRYCIHLHQLTNTLTEGILQSLTMTLFREITLSHIIRQRNDQLIVWPF